jgi:NAD(P)-dependent dehydrogenase (short-subunit alcohol dehydrogenase family)
VLTPGSPRLQGRLALVTGGASGIGAATARRFSAEGAHVVVADRDEEGAQKLAADIGSEAVTSVGGALTAGALAPLGIGYVVLDRTFDLGRHYLLVSGILLVVTAVLNPAEPAPATAGAPT